MALHADWQLPPPDLELAPLDVDVWQVRLDGIDRSEESDVTDLSEAERERASRFRFEADRRRFLKSHKALRRILATYLDSSPGTLILSEGPHGKPFLQAPAHGRTLRFSLSHCDRLALLAVSRGREVGVDVERVRPVDNSAGVVAGFFSRAERQALERVASEDRLRAFLATWVLKEAYLKACGEGLLRSLDAFDVTTGEEQPPQLLEVRDRPGDAARWSLRRLALGEQFVAALAAEGNDWQLRQWVSQGTQPGGSC